MGAISWEEGVEVEGEEAAEHRGPENTRLFPGEDRRTGRWAGIGGWVRREAGAGSTETMEVRLMEDPTGTQTVIVEPRV